MKLILVVDDDEHLRRMVVRLLALHDIAAIAAANTDDVLKTLASGKVDAVLLDIVLGMENGWETMRLIREKSAVPVVMMSGAYMDEDARKDAAAIGAQAILQKPFESHELLACLNGLFEPRR
ncbi:MAG: response regulator [Elusimicrobia bacterium]|nr:response regulator [Elusimicrobiota bacterium]